MRQQNSDLVELLDAFARDGHWFGRVRLERNGEQKCFQFGVSQAGYLALQRAVQLRPFDQLPAHAASNSDATNTTAFGCMPCSM